MIKITYILIIVSLVSGENLYKILDSVKVFGRWTGDSSIPLTMQIKGVDYDSNLYVTFIVSVNKTTYEVANYKYPKIEENKIWFEGSFVKRCQSESDCRKKYFLTDWPDYQQQFKISNDAILQIQNQIISFFIDTLKYSQKKAKEISKRYTERIFCKKQDVIWIGRHPEELYAYLWIKEANLFLKLIQ